jgi:hypothetical protein
LSSLYHDHLVEITDTEMVFHHYYFPFGQAKRVPLDRIQSIEAKSPTLWNGKWRLWGGNFGIWFPNDIQRFKRDLIFLAKVRDSKTRIGFTVEHSQEVVTILKSRGIDLVKTDTTGI